MHYTARSHCTLPVPRSSLRTACASCFFNGLAVTPLWCTPLLVLNVHCLQLVILFVCTPCTSYLLCITYASFSCALPAQLRNKLVCCPLTALVVPILLPLALVLVLLLSPCTGAHCTRALWCPYCCSVLQYGCTQVLLHWCSLHQSTPPLNCTCLLHSNSCAR